MPVLALLLVLLCISLTGCGGREEVAGAKAVAEAPTGRFDIVKTRRLFVRLDSATGQVWLAPLNGDGGWGKLGDAPPGAGHPEANGRYRVHPLGAKRGLSVGENLPRLLRTDRATGRAWIADAALGSDWELLGEEEAGTPQAGDAS